MSKLHMTGDDSVALCGWMAVETTDERDAVTCRLCLRAMLRRDAAQEPAWAAPPPSQAVMGQRRLDAGSRRALDASTAEAVHRLRQWPKPETAVRAWVAMRDKGGSTGSTSDPDRAIRIQSNRRPDVGGPEHRAIDKTRNVGLALVDGLFNERLDTHVCPSATPQEALSIYLAAVCGKTVRWNVPGRKSVLPMRRGMTVAETVDHAQEHGVHVTARQVGRIVRHFNAAVRARLEVSGEMAEAPRSEQTREWDPLGRIRP